VLAEEEPRGPSSARRILALLLSINWQLALVDDCLEHLAPER